MVVSLPGLVTVFRIPYSGTMRNLFVRKNNKIHLAKAGWMCYYYDRRDTDERCLPPLTSEITPSSFGEDRDGVISYFYRNYYHLLFL